MRDALLSTQRLLVFSRFTRPVCFPTTTCAVPPMHGDGDGCVNIDTGHLKTAIKNNSILAAIDIPESLYTKFTPDDQMTTTRMSNDDGDILSRRQTDGAAVAAAAAAGTGAHPKA